MVHSSACFLSTCQQVHILSLRSIFSTHAFHTGYHAVYLLDKGDLGLVNTTVLHSLIEKGGRYRKFRM